MVVAECRRSGRLSTASGMSSSYAASSWGRALAGRAYQTTGAEPVWSRCSSGRPCGWVCQGRQEYNMCRCTCTCQSDTLFETWCLNALAANKQTLRTPHWVQAGRGRWSFQEIGSHIKTKQVPCIRSQMQRIQHCLTDMAICPGHAPAIQRCKQDCVTVYCILLPINNLLLFCTSQSGGGDSKAWLARLQD